MSVSVHNVSHGTDDEQDVRVKVRGGNNDILRPGERGNYPEVDNLNDLSTHCAIFRNGQQILQSNLEIDRQGPQSNEEAEGAEEYEDSDDEHRLENAEPQEDRDLTKAEPEQQPDDSSDDSVEVTETDESIESDESEDVDESESADLEELEYSELQELAKEHDIPANQSTEDLIGAIQEEQ